MQYAKPITDRALHKWHVNGAETKIHLDVVTYSLWVQKNSARGVQVGAGPLNVIWDLLIYRKLLELES